VIRADHRARLRANTAWLLVARVGTQGLLVLYTIILARRLGVVGLGEYAFVASAVFLANVLTTFGTDMLLVRNIAASGRPSRLAAAFAIQLALSVPLIALALAAAPAVPNQSEDAVAALRIYSLALVPLAAFTVFTAGLRGVGGMDAYTLLNLVVSGVQVGLAWLFVPQGGSVVTVAALLLLTQVFAAALGALVCGIRIPRFWSGWHTSGAEIRSLARESAPIALLGALGMVYQRSMVYMLATTAGAGTTGWYSAALRAVEASKTGHLAAFGALYPAFAQTDTVTATPARWRPTLTVSLTSLLLVAAAAAVALTLLADPLVPLLYGPGFGPAISALRILGWVLVPYTISAYLSLGFVARRRERPVARALAVSVIALVVLGAWWIPREGLLGACWATLAAETLQAVVLLAQWR
jgi:O-antigen/teichoic acid export membrane protein